MKKLFKNKKGFTLMEMLIVVAIIVILVAVSMPVFTSQLDNARKATDDANIRAARSAGVARFLSEADADKITYTSGKAEFKYDAEAGVLKGTGESVTGYGKSTANKGKVITVTIKDTGEVTAAFPSGS